MKLCSKGAGIKVIDLGLLYRVRDTQKAERIWRDSTHPLCSEYQLLPSGRRHCLACCRTNRFKFSFIPAATTFLNSIMWFCVLWCMCFVGYLAASCKQTAPSGIISRSWSLNLDLHHISFSFFVLITTFKWSCSAHNVLGFFVSSDQIQVGSVCLAKLLSTQFSEWL